LQTTPAQLAFPVPALVVLEPELQAKYLVTHFFQRRAHLGLKTISNWHGTIQSLRRK